MGVAMMELPFFAIACVVSFIMGQPVDGFSGSFQLLIFAGSLLYVITAFFYLRRLLKYFFDDWIVAIILLTLALGTNIYFFSVYEGTMAHAYLFFLYSLLFYGTVKWYEGSKRGWAFTIGICCGLITLIRPNEIISVLIPILYGISYFGSFRGWIDFVTRHWQIHAATVCMFIAVGLPQLIYWKMLTGNFFFYSYGNEGFDFIHPKILNGIFSFNNGWLVYTPVMFFAIIGLLFIPQQNHFRIAIPVYLIIYVYVIYSYLWWDYYNGFGSRPMVETYPALALPLGYLFHRISKISIARVGAVIVFAFFILLNLFQVWQYHHGILWTSIGTRSSYAYLFGKTSMTTKALVLYDTNEPQPSHVSYVKTIPASLIGDSIFQRGITETSDSVFLIQRHEEEFTNLIKVSGSDLSSMKGNYLKISVEARNDNYQFDLWRMTALIVSIDGSVSPLLWKAVRIQNESGSDHPGLWNCTVGDWYHFDYFICVPANLPNDAKLQMYLWNQCKCNQIAIRNFNIEVWKE